MIDPSEFPSEFPAVFRSVRLMHGEKVIIDHPSTQRSAPTHQRIDALESALLDAAVAFECLETVDGNERGKRLRAIVGAS